MLNRAPFALQESGDQRETWAVQTRCHQRPGRSVGQTWAGCPYVGFAGSIMYFNMTVSSSRDLGWKIETQKHRKRGRVVKICEVCMKSWWSSWLQPWVEIPLAFLNLGHDQRGESHHKSSFRSLGTNEEIQSKRNHCNKYDVTMISWIIHDHPSLSRKFSPYHRAKYWNQGPTNERRIDSFGLPFIVKENCCFDGWDAVRFPAKIGDVAC